MKPCPYCRKLLIADMEETVSYTPFEDKDEAFFLHKHCADEFMLAFQKLKSKKKKQDFFLKLLKRLSDS